MKLQFPSGRAGVDAFSKRDEPDTERPQFIEQRDEMPEISTEPVQSPAHQDIELPSPRILQQFIESGASILRTTDASVHELGGRPSPRLDIAPEFQELVLGFLVERRDAGVDGGFHHSNIHP
jgi:hypothetical protein